MIQVKITPEIIARAKKKAATVGNLQGSITGSLSHVVGAIGEVIVADAINGTHSNTYDYDLVRDGERIDVKTKRCNTRPFHTTTVRWLHTGPSKTATVIYLYAS